VIGFGVGEHTIAGFPIADSVSVADPLPSILGEPTRKREYVLRASPTSGGVAQTVDLSGSGYTSRSTDTPYKHFPGALSRPYNFSVNLPLPDMSGGTQLGIGEMVINNPDGLRDADALYDWLGANADTYLGLYAKPEGEPFSLFTRVFQGTTAGVSWDLDRLYLLHRDLRFSLQRRLQQSRYGGFGAAVSGNGTTTYGTCTMACPAGAMTLECRFYADTSVDALRYLIGYQSSALAGMRVLRFTTGAVNRLEFRVINDAGTQYATSYDGVPASDWKAAAGVLDIDGTGAGFIRLYLNGEPVGTPTAVSGSWATVLSAYTVMRRPDAASNWLPGDFDDARVWSVARTANEIKKAYTQALSGGETGLYSYHRLDEGSGTSGLNQVAGKPTLTLTSPTWIGSLEGDASLVGVPKPIALGKRRQVAPRLVDPQNNVYQVHDGPIQAIDAVRDNGDPRTFGSNLSDIYASAPAGATYNTCLTKGLIRFAAAPTGVLTCDVQGDNGGSLGYESTAGGIHRKLVTQWGGLIDPDQIDLTAYAALDVLNSAVVGFYFDEDINVDAAADQVIKSISAWWSPNRQKQVTVGRIDDPTDEETSVQWTADDLIDPADGGTFRRDPLGIRVGEVVLGYRPYHTTLSADQSATSLSLTTRLDYSKDYRFVSSVDPDRSDDADVMTVYTDIDDPVEAQEEADRLLAFYSVDRDKLTVTPKIGALSYFVGSIGSVTMDRYNLSAGKKFVFAGLTEDLGEHTAPDRLEVVLVG
jgi:hypothetical protein